MSDIDTFTGMSFQIRRLTRYEIARVIGARSLQLAMGAPPLVDPEKIKIKDPVALAIKELLEGVLPMTIRRVKPGGDYVLIPVTKLLSEDNRRYLRTTLKSWDLSRRG